MSTGRISARSATAVQKIMDEAAKKTAEEHDTSTLRGQIATMQTSFYRLGLGLIFAIVLVYFLMALNFQSWLDPFIILTALPGALAGILWMLFVTQTTLQRAFSDGRDHVHRGGDREQHSDGGFRERSAAGRHGRARRGAGRRVDADPAGADDRFAR